MSSTPNTSLNLPPKGRVFSILSEEPREPLHWLAMIKHEFDTSISIFSRLSPQRLGQHLSLEKIEFKWLSEAMDPHALSPSLERIHHAISTRIVTDSGIIWLDAVEYLIQRQGFDAFLAFTRSLADELNGSEWTVLLPFTPLSLDGTEIAHLRREAIPFRIDKIKTSITEIEKSKPEQPDSLPDSEHVEPEESPSPETAVESPIKMLSSIAEAALTTAVLSRRIDQWVGMGFDVSALDQAMNSDSAERYSIYREVEERVRRAVECERRIQMIEIRGHSVVATKMRFRIMQLTGLNNVESQLDDILQGEKV
ncbi:MAG: DUF835 domain-containing protein [Candidatus Thalassarchaeaceae archaeon]|nr:DUF835 domain-containing protein [Candidatus Thalassarchaeaceae archaeon]